MKGLFRSRIEFGNFNVPWIFKVPRDQERERWRKKVDFIFCFNKIVIWWKAEQIAGVESNLG
jgi:hypothetical protein